MVDLVVSSKLKDYRKKYMIPSNVSDGMAFGRFANHTIVAMHQPDVIDSDTELLDLICVDGQNDMGIDGLAIKFNGNFIKSCSQIDDLIDLNKSNPANAEFIFIQSKYRDELDSGEYGKFCDGIADFLSNVHHEPRNEKIDDLLKIKDYLFSDKIFDQLSWSENPTVRVYFVTMGEWDGNEHIEAKFDRLKDDIKKENIYGNVISNVIDCNKFKKIRNDLDNVFSISIVAAGSFCQKTAEVYCQPAPDVVVSKQPVCIDREKYAKNRATLKQHRSIALNISRSVRVDRRHCSFSGVSKSPA